MNSAVSAAERPAAGPGPQHWALLGLAVAGAAVVCAAVALSYAGTADQPGLIAPARALIVGAPFAIGLYAWHRGQNRRFGVVLMVAACGWLVTTLAESADPVAYTVGRAAGWLVEVLVVVLVLAFPTARLSHRIDRRLAGAMAAVVALFYLPQLVVAQTFSVPSPYTSCIRDCPDNALFALGSEPAFVQGVMRPLGAVLVLCVMVAVVLRLYRRLRDSTPLTRRMLAPVVVIAMARAGALGIAIVARELEPDGWPIQLASWMLALAIPMVAVAFLVGLLRWRLFAERALRRLAACVRSLPDASTLRRAFADAFDDPTVEIVFPAAAPDESWIDCWGHRVAPPRPGAGRAVTKVRRHDRVIAAIVHDEALRDRPEVVEAGASMAAIVLENQRLVAETEAALDEVRSSRARLAAGAEQERRRIERDLHDGAQQRLVAIRIELELVEDIVRQDTERGVARLRELEVEVEEALEELRALAHGVYPAALVDLGLAEAVRAVAARSPVRVDLVTHDMGRYSTEVEGAVYFCVLEALQNVQKHARGVRRVVVTLDGATGGTLRFVVRDDGAGVAAIVVGAGITNMGDRLAAIAGEIGIASTPGVGTVVRGRVPTR